MRSFILSILIGFSTCCASAQNKGLEGARLQVTKKGNAQDPRFLIRQDKQIIIRAADGSKATLSEYVLLADSSIASPTDTFLLREITSIKAQVEVSEDRKALGVALKVIGIAYTAGGLTFGIGVLVFTGNPIGLLLVLPAFGVAYTGSVLSGRRRFKTDAWEVSFVPTQE